MRNVDALVLDVAPMLIMGHFGGAAAAAYFRIAQRFLRLPLMLLQGISRTAVPAFSGLVGRADADVFRRSFYKATVFGGLMIASGLLVTVPLVPALTEAVFPADYGDAVPRFAWILAAGFAVTGFSGAIESFYIASERVAVALRIGFFLCVPLVGLMVALGWLVGPDGVAAGLSLTMMIGLVHHAYIAHYFRRAVPTVARPAEVTP
jgi:O-antigen/teichoic acid export membrane protein